MLQEKREEWGQEQRKARDAPVRVQEGANILPTDLARVSAEFGQFETRPRRVLLYLYDLALLHAGTAAAATELSQGVTQGR